MNMDMYDRAALSISAAKSTPKETCKRSFVFKIAQRRTGFSDPL